MLYTQQPCYGCPLLIRFPRESTDLSIVLMRALLLARSFPPPPSAHRFVYDLPSDFNTNLLDPAVPRYYSCRDSMYAAEIMIHEQLLTSPFRTLDPKEANLFFVPIYTSCFRAVRVHVNSRKLKDRDGTVLRGRGTTVEEDMFHFVYSALDYISQEFPYWNQQQGRDHILTFAHDFGACFTYHQEETYKIERLQIQQALHNAILLQYLGDLKSTCFHSHKDIVIPPVVTNKHLLALKGGEKSKPIADRKTGVYFRGKIQFDGGATRPGYSRGVRAQLNSTYHSDPFFSINEGHSPSYIDELTDSKMCLAPPGYALWTPRLTEAILVGCIPLVIGDDVELPFEGLVDYRSLAVRVHEKDTGSLANIVKGISDDALEKKRSNVRHVWQRYRYNNPSQRGDAFDSIMQLLAQKVRGRDRPVGNDAFI